MRFSDHNGPLLPTEQLERVADDSSTLLMHAAIGGLEQYHIVCQKIRKTRCMDPMLLSWAAKRVDIRVLNAVTKGIKVRNRTVISISGVGISFIPRHD